ncbi:MAG: hypothetical protein AAF591_18020 [Verrucomicrobiota bacterium]
MMKKSMFRGMGSRLVGGLVLSVIFVGGGVLMEAWGVEWVRIKSQDGKLSAEFPKEVQNYQTQTETTAAGKVVTTFGVYDGDGILLSGSGSGVPGLAKMLVGEGGIFNGSKKRLLGPANGEEVSWKETTIGGYPARILEYRNKPGTEAYTGKAAFILVGKRMYTLNAVLTKDTPENQAMVDRLANSIETH